MARISAGIVTYNDFDEAYIAANTVLEHCPEAKLFLIDNASPDGTGEQIEKALGERAAVLRLPRNVGFGSGHNAVLPHLDSEYHFVLNPDIQVTDSVMQDMCGWMDAHPDVVMCTPQLYFPEGGVQHLPRRIPNFMALLARQVPGFKPLQGFDIHYTMQDEDLTKVQDIQFCTGSFFCIRTETFKKIGGFDQGYFMYVEDADITRKAMEQGRVCFLPQFKAVHYWHRSPSKQLRHFRMQCVSMLRYFKRWGFRLY